MASNVLSEPTNSTPKHSLAWLRNFISPPPLSHFCSFWRKNEWLHSPWLWRLLFLFKGQADLKASENGGKQRPKQPTDIYLHLCQHAHIETHTQTKTITCESKLDFIFDTKQFHSFAKACLLPKSCSVSVNFPSTKTPQIFLPCFNKVEGHTNILCG